MSVNFGQKIFKYDVQALLSEYRAQEKASLAQIQVDDVTTNRLVRDYLLHCGYSKTLAALDAATGLDCTSFHATEVLPKTPRAQAQSSAKNGDLQMDIDRTPQARTSSSLQSPLLSRVCIFLIDVRPSAYVRMPI